MAMPSHLININNYYIFSNKYKRKLKNIQFKVFFNNIFCKTDIYIFMKFKIHHPKKSFTVLRHTLCWNKLLLKVIVLHKKSFFQGLT